jgi:Helix-turn-helix of DDE superfamily endonuclease
VLRSSDVATKPARLRALTTLEPNEFRDLVPAFETAFLAHMQQTTIDGLPRRNRRYVAYKTSPLPTIEDKLLFILVHLKQNLTQEVQGEVFGMVQSDAHKWLTLLRPVLADALERLDVMPSRLATVLAPQSEGAEAAAMSSKNTGVARRNAIRSRTLC